MVVLRRWLLAVVLVFGIGVLRASAAEVDKYLPNDTDAVATVNVRQILASPLVKTYYLESLQEWVKTNEDMQKLVKGLGIDPLKDIDQLIFSNGESLYRLAKRVEKGETIYGSDPGVFFLVKGKFDVAKARAYGEQLAKEKDGVLVKTHKVGAAAVYELDIAGTIFVGVADSTTIAVSTRLEPVAEVLEKAAGKRKSVFKYKELAAAVARIDAKKSAGIAVIANAGFGLDANVKKVGGKIVSETPVKQTISEDGINSISGSINITDGIVGEVTVGVKGAAVAKDVAKTVQGDVSRGIELILKALFKYPKLGPFAEFIKSINIAVKDNRTVTIKSEVTAKQAADALK
jgi:hypothetical protein